MSPNPSSMGGRSASMLQPESTLKTKYANEAENWTQRLNQDLDDEIAQV